MRLWIVNESIYYGVIGERELEFHDIRRPVSNGESICGKIAAQMICPMANIALSGPVDPYEKSGFVRSRLAQVCIMQLNEMVLQNPLCAHP